MNKQILLIEPGYKNKYPPLGLMKIAQYHGPEGKDDNVRFIKGTTDKSVLEQAWDRIYVTSLFSFEWKKTAKAIDFALEVAKGNGSNVFVGGVAASLLHDSFLAERRWHGIRFIKGLLTDDPATSLHLDSFSEELYSEDTTSEPIENLTPDYSILEQVECQHKYSVSDAYFLYASRGCIRKCKFCGVPTLEGPQRDSYSISDSVKKIAEMYGEKKDLILMDNNFSASSRFKEIIAEIRDLGFTPGATITRGNRPVLRRVDFNQGLDARILCKVPMFIKELSTICIRPLRVAFDHIGFRKVYSQAVEHAASAGLPEISNYMLYNFKDGPEDLFQRMQLNVALRQKYGVPIYSFPMRYQPTTLKDRSHIGDKWNRYYLRSVQLILQATHGVVSSSKSFANRAFGETEQEFVDLLMWPNRFIFNRAWYQELDGQDELSSFQSKLSKLTNLQREQLLEFISAHYNSQYEKALVSLESKKLRDIAHYYVPLTEDDERKIWNVCKERRQEMRDAASKIPEDEFVEDAGLELAS